jgi:hypothetical protein
MPSCHERRISPAGLRMFSRSCSARIAGHPEVTTGKTCPPLGRHVSTPLAVLLRFGFSVFQADWIVLKGPLSIVTCIPGIK